jgi:hypothetical protein
MPSNWGKFMRLASFLTAGVVATVVTAGAGTALADTSGTTPTSAVKDDAAARHFASATPFARDGVVAQGLVITEVQTGVRNPNKVAECYQAQGGDCTISQSVAIRATVNSSVGVSFAAINAQLGGSYSETLTTQISCSNNLAPRQYLRAYPSGDFVFFEADGSKRTAFLPTRVQCQVEE